MNRKCKHKWTYITFGIYWCATCGSLKGYVNYSKRYIRPKTYKDRLNPEIALQA